jgi:catechol 2,3-dioxygenase-like lactoylglutathione lyase family enzyme
MSDSQVQIASSAGTSEAPAIQMVLEVVIIPVSDVDRSKAFYSRLGWRLDADFSMGDGYRIVQLTPPGSPCSIHFGIGLTAAPPGSAQGMYLVVSDIEAARRNLVGNGADVSEIVHRDARGPATLKGPHPNHQSYASFASFNDPDGNRWILQEVTSRLPGRMSSDTRYTSTDLLVAALKRAAVAHGQHEKKLGRSDEDWPDWYAAYMVAEQAGLPAPT